MMLHKKYSFFSHPNSVCMSYFKHMGFSLMLATQFIWGSTKAVIHAFIPNFFIKGSSDTVKAVSYKLETSGCNRSISNCPTL
jgi:hypothetical protein